MPYAAINNAQIYYETAGDEHEHAVVFAHAGIADSRMWQPQVAPFAQHYRVVTFDARGYGKSAPVDGEFRFTDDLAALLDHLQIERAALVGCSMNGMVCMDFTLQWPERVPALVMVASRPHGSGRMDAATIALIEAASAAGGDEANPDIDKINAGEIDAWVVGIGRARKDMDAMVLELALEMNKQALTYEVMEIGEALPPYFPDAADRLSTIAQPVLIVYGNHDRAYVTDAAERMAREIPQARKVLLESTAHLPNLERPAVFNREVLTFLRESGW